MFRGAVASICLLYYAIADYALGALEGVINLLAISLLQVLRAIESKLQLRLDKAEPGVLVTTQSLPISLTERSAFRVAREIVANHVIPATPLDVRIGYCLAFFQVLIDSTTLGKVSPSGNAG